MSETCICKGSLATMQGQMQRIFEAHNYTSVRSRTMTAVQSFKFFRHGQAPEETGRLGVNQSSEGKLQIRGHCCREIPLKLLCHRFMCFSGPTKWKTLGSQPTRTSHLSKSSAPHRTSALKRRSTERDARHGVHKSWSSLAITQILWFQKRKRLPGP